MLSRRKVLNSWARWFLLFCACGALKSCSAPQGNAVVDDPISESPVTTPVQTEEETAVGSTIANLQRIVAEQDREIERLRGELNEAQRTLERLERDGLQKTTTRPPSTPNDEPLADSNPACSEYQRIELVRIISARTWGADTSGVDISVLDQLAERDQRRIMEMDPACWKPLCNSTWRVFLPQDYDRLSDWLALEAGAISVEAREMYRRNLDRLDERIRRLEAVCAR